MIPMREGDTGPAAEATIKRGGVVVDLTGCTVTFTMREQYTSGYLKIDASSVTVTNASAGEVEYVWATDGTDTDEPGVFHGTWKVTFPDGHTETFPTLHPDIILVKGALV
jgi:hypothetical protein